MRAVTDVNTPELLVRLAEDHRRIGSVMRRLERAGDDLSGSASNVVWAELKDCLAHLEHYADHIHHPLEDRIFDVVLHKGLTPTERHLVFQNLGQHQDLISRTETLRAAAVAALAGNVVDPDDYVDSLVGYLDAQRRHMTFEEMHMFPLLEARLDEDDWKTLLALHEEQARDERPEQGERRE